MQDSTHSDPTKTSPDFDYSTPEAQKALEGVTALILEIRREATSPMARRMALYERTLGLAVIPVLLRRVVVIFARKVRRKSRGAE